MEPFDTSPDRAGAPDSLAESAALLSKKWHPAILRALSADDGLGFSDLEDRLDGVSAKVLTDALEELRDYEIVARTEVAQRPLRVEYTLTEPGEDLAAIVDSLADWGEQHLTPADDRVVLVAEDDRRIAAMHTTWLEDDYTVRTARDGEAALRELDTDVDVVVLDRRMPGLSGDEVLDWIRSQQFDCRVVLVTSEDPSLDALDLQFDEYVAKPVLRDELCAVVSSLFERRDYDAETRQYLALRAKLATLESVATQRELETSDAYARYRTRLATLRDRVDDVADIELETDTPTDAGTSQR